MGRYSNSTRHGLLTVCRVSLIRSYRSSWWSTNRVKHFTAHRRPSAFRIVNTLAEAPLIGLGIPSWSIVTSPPKSIGSLKHSFVLYSASRYSPPVGYVSVEDIALSTYLCGRG